MQTLYQYRTYSIDSSEESSGKWQQLLHDCVVNKKGGDDFHSSNSLAFLSSVL